MSPSQDNTPPTWPASYAELLNDLCERLRVVVAEEVRKALLQADPEVTRVNNEIDARLLAALCRLCVASAGNPASGATQDQWWAAHNIEYGMANASIARLNTRGLIVKTYIETLPPHGYAYWGPQKVEVYLPTQLGREVNRLREASAAPAPASTENKEKPDGS